MVYMYHSFLVHSSADGHLGCFYVLAMINSAAMNIGVHVSLSDLVSLVCMPRSEKTFFDYPVKMICILPLNSLFKSNKDNFIEIILSKIKL